MNDLLIVISELEKRVEEISDSFYQQKEKEGYQLFEKLYPVLIRVVESILVIEDISKVTLEEKGKITECLMSALQSLENKDVVLVSDILRYDLMELLNSIVEKCNS